MSGSYAESPRNDGNEAVTVRLHSPTNSLGYPNMSGLASVDGSIDPEQLFADGDVDTERRTYTHEDPDHCETGAVGRSIVGVTDEAGRLLLVVDPDAETLILPNDTVEPGGDWRAAGRDRVEAMAGIEASLDDVVLVRRVEHEIEGSGCARTATTHHVLFEASVDPDAALDGLCEDNDWELGWYDEVPFEFDDHGTGALEDVSLFLE